MAFLTLYDLELLSIGLEVAEDVSHFANALVAFSLDDVLNGIRLKRLRYHGPAGEGRSSYVENHFWPLPFLHAGSLTISLRPLSGAPPRAPTAPLLCCGRESSRGTCGKDASSSSSSGPRRQTSTETKVDGTSGFISIATIAVVSNYESSSSGFVLRQFVFHK